MSEGFNMISCAVRFTLCILVLYVGNSEAFVVVCFGARMQMYAGFSFSFTSFPSPAIILGVPKLSAAVDRGVGAIRVVLSKNSVREIRMPAWTFTRYSFLGVPRTSA